MSIVHHKDKRTGVTYVYESESYWDKEKKQPRSRRKLIGKIDEETGEIVPTGKSGRKKTQPDASVPEQPDIIRKKDEIIREMKAENAVLKNENAALRKEKAEILKALRTLCQKISD